MGFYHNSGYNTYNAYIDNWLVVELHLKKIMEFVKWDYDIPNRWKKIEMFQTTICRHLSDTLSKSDVDSLLFRCPYLRLVTQTLVKRASCPAFQTTNQMVISDDYHSISFHIWLPYNWGHNCTYHYLSRGHNRSGMSQSHPWREQFRLLIMNEMIWWPEAKLVDLICLTIFSKHFKIISYQINHSNAAR